MSSLSQKYAKSIDGLFRVFLYKKGSLIYNPYVLYFLLLLAVVRVFAWMQSKLLDNVLVFVIAGYLVSQFSKNFVVILTLALVLSTVYSSMFHHRSTEGLTEQDKDTDKEDKDDKDKEKDKEKDKDQDGNKDNKDNKDKDQKKTLDLIGQTKEKGLELKALTGSIKEQLQELIPDMKRAESLVNDMKSSSKQIKDLAIKSPSPSPSPSSS
jgi:hypothetical protein